MLCNPREAKEEPPCDHVGFQTTDDKWRDQNRILGDSGDILQTSQRSVTLEIGIIYIAFNMEFSFKNEPKMAKKLYCPPPHEKKNRFLVCIVKFCAVQGDIFIDEGKYIISNEACLCESWACGAAFSNSRSQFPGGLQSSCARVIWLESDWIMHYNTQGYFSSQLSKLPRSLGLLKVYVN